jgi:hypothetical protein
MNSFLGPRPRQRSSGPKPVNAMDTSKKELTPRAHQALACARKEAVRLRHRFLGTEHLLLGLIRLGQGAACNVLTKTGLELKAVRDAVENRIGPGPEDARVGNVPCTPRAQKVLALAETEAHALGHTFVGTEHILLGLLSEREGVAARVLRSFGVDTDQTRLEILKELDPNFEGTLEDVDFIMAQTRLRSDVVDTGRRYDVYCRERDQQIVVYRNVLFLGRSQLPGTDPHDFQGGFLKLEQANGQTLYLSMPSVMKFCEHGVNMEGESIS